MVEGCECPGPEVVYGENLEAEAASLRSEVERLRAGKDEAYTERNRLIAALARVAVGLGWPAGRRSHEPDPDPTWDDDWKNVVIIDLPTGQVSWHYRDGERHLFGDLPPYDGHWDGHNTTVKYDRLAALSPAQAARAALGRSETP